MKKSLLILAALLATTQLFAVKLPEGTNARVADIKQDGEAIIETKLLEPTVLNTPLGALECTDVVTFYKSGKLKTCFLNKPAQIKTELGEMTLDGSARCYPNHIIEFYESGALKRVNLASFAVLQTGIGKVPLNRGEITFYDSGNAKKFQLRTFSIAPQYPPTFSCAAGNFYMLPTTKMQGGQIYTQYPSGKMKIIHSAESTFKIKTPLGETFGKDTAKFYKKPMTLREDGSILAFTTNDLIITEIAGIKVKIPAETYLTFYPNGNICEFTTSSDITLKLGNNKVTFSESSTFRASKDGKKIIASQGYDFTKSDGGTYKLTKDSFVESMHDNGVPHKFTDPDSSHTKFCWIDKDVKNRVVGVRNFMHCRPLKTDNYSKEVVGAFEGMKNYYLQEGDAPENVGMVYFANDGTPSSYSTYIYDAFGEVVLDETNLPAIDSNKKKFSRVEETTDAF